MWVGRFYERFADHAVEIGRRVIFQATGEAPACEVRQSSRCDRHTFGVSKVPKQISFEQSELAVSDAQAISAVSSTAEQAAMKCLYLVTRSLNPTGAGRAR